MQRLLDDAGPLRLGIRDPGGVIPEEQLPQIGAPVGHGLAGVEAENRPGRIDSKIDIDRSQFGFPQSFAKSKGKGIEHGWPAR